MTRALIGTGLWTAGLDTPPDARLAGGLQ